MTSKLIGSGRHVNCYLAAWLGRARVSSERRRRFRQVCTRLKPRAVFDPSVISLHNSRMGCSCSEGKVKGGREFSQAIPHLPLPRLPAHKAGTIKATMRRHPSYVESLGSADRAVQLTR